MSKTSDMLAAREARKADRAARTAAIAAAPAAPEGMEWYSPPGKGAAIYLRPVCPGSTSDWCWQDWVKKWSQVVHDNPKSTSKPSSTPAMSFDTILAAYVRKADAAQRLKLLEHMRRHEHPDKGGDSALAAQINRLIDAVKQ